MKKVLTALFLACFVLTPIACDEKKSTGGASTAPPAPPAGPTGGKSTTPVTPKTAE